MIDFQHSISRREFLKTCLYGLMGVSSLPFVKPYQKFIEQYGRVLDPIIYSYEEPTFQSKIIFSYQKDDVIAITDLTFSEDGPTYNKVWYQVNHAGYTHSGAIQPVQYKINPIITEIPQTGLLAEVTVPYSDSYRGPGNHYQATYRLYYESVHWVTNIVRGQDDDYWYRILDDEYKIPMYALAKHIKILTPLDTSPIAGNVAPENKYLIVSLSNQVVIAYEFDVPVFMARASTGGKFRDGRNVTPIGIHRIFYKRPSRHMVGGEGGHDLYDYIGVPWVSYINDNGIAFHGVYWHNNFGYSKSHGCINLDPSSAKWIYRWSTPNAPFELPEWRDKTGTLVLINE